MLLWTKEHRFRCFPCAEASIRRLQSDLMSRVFRQSILRSVQQSASDAGSCIDGRHGLFAGSRRSDKWEMLRTCAPGPDSSFCILHPDLAGPQCWEFSQRGRSHSNRPEDKRSDTCGLLSARPNSHMGRVTVRASHRIHIILHHLHSVRCSKFRYVRFCFSAAYASGNGFRSLPFKISSRMWGGTGLKCMRTNTNYQGEILEKSRCVSAACWGSIAMKHSRC